MTHPPNFLGFSIYLHSKKCSHNHSPYTSPRENIGLCQKNLNKDLGELRVYDKDTGTQIPKPYYVCILFFYSIQSHYNFLLLYTAKCSTWYAFKIEPN